jgi:hypothetical protein
MLDWLPNHALQAPLAHSHNAIIRVYTEAGNVIETHGHAGKFKEV